MSHCSPRKILVQWDRKVADVVQNTKSNSELGRRTYLLVFRFGFSVNAVNMDPFAILPQEKSRYVEQFNSLKPANGLVSGDQAKGFLLQSQLPPPILGQIWYVSCHLEFI